MIPHYFFYVQLFITSNFLIWYAFKVLFSNAFRQELTQFPKPGVCVRHKLDTNFYERIAFHDYKKMT